MAMYESYFGLREKPFNATADLRFLYLSEKHRQALDFLINGIQKRKGLVVLEGHSGTGKTTIVKALLMRLDENHRVAHVPFTNLNATEFLKYACHGFGLEEKGQPGTDSLKKLLQFLIESHGNDKTFVLIIDEAQNLDASVLEEISMLMKQGESHAVPLQVLLVGTPELHDLLNRSALRELIQRPGAYSSLPPMDRSETEAYIQTRMEIAGANGPGSFTSGAIQRAHECSGGVPRIINSICDHSLLIGYANDTQTIEKATVEESIRDAGLACPSLKEIQRGETVRKENLHLPVTVSLLLVLLCAVLSMLFVFSTDRGGVFRPSGVPYSRDFKTTHIGKDSTAVNDQPLHDQGGQHTRSDRDLKRSLGEPLSEGSEVGKEKAPQENTVLDSSQNDLPVLILTVKKGDTVGRLLKNRFGTLDKTLIAAVRMLNPELDSLDQLRIGQSIRLPLNREAADDIEKRLQGSPSSPSQEWEPLVSATSRD
jgi:general secretion pathway protein A